jgi:phage-related protein (TIGR01555 family)
MGTVAELKQDGTVAKEKKVSRLDGWVNLLTGLGTAARDKLVNTVFQRSVRLQDEQLEALFDNDDMAARIVEAIPDDALRQGFKVNVETSDEDGEISVEESLQMSAGIMNRLDELEAVPKLNEAWVWGRLFGGGAVYIVADDPAGPEEPLDLERMTRVVSLMVLDRRDLCAHTHFMNAEEDNFGEVETYRLTRIGQASTSVASVSLPLVVHSSRLVIFEGERTTKTRKAENQGWSHSVLQRPCAPLRNFNAGFDSTAHLMTDSAQAVFKMKGLIEMISSGASDILQQRMQVVDMGRSVTRAVVIDEDETFERVETTFAGHKDALEQSTLRLAASARMPVTKMMGQSPAGMDATGESDQALWDDIVKAEQTRTLKPRLEKLLQVLFHESDSATNGTEPETWSIEFKPLRQMTPAEEAELRLKVAQADQIWVNTGLVFPEEAALSHFKATGFDPDIRIERSMREDVLEVDKERMAEPSTEPEPESTEPPPQESSEPAEPVDTEAADPTTAFNGAQVQALQGILQQVIDKTMPRDTAAATISVAFPLSEAEALQLVNTIPEDFEPGGDDEESGEGGNPPPPPPPPPNTDDVPTDPGRPAPPAEPPAEPLPEEE